MADAANVRAESSFAVIAGQSDWLALAIWVFSPVMSGLVQNFCFLIVCRHTMMETFSPGITIFCCGFPVCGIDLERKHGGLARVFEPQLGSAPLPTTSSQFPVQYLSWDAAVVHAVHVTKPSEPSLAKQSLH